MQLRAALPFIALAGLALPLGACQAQPPAASAPSAEAAAPSPSPPAFPTWAELMPRLQLFKSQDQGADLSPGPGFSTEVRFEGEAPPGATLRGHLLELGEPGIVRVRVDVTTPTQKPRWNLTLFKADPSASGFLPLSTPLNHEPVLFDVAHLFTKTPLFPMPSGEQPGAVPTSVRLFGSDEAFLAAVSKGVPMLGPPSLPPGRGPILALRARVMDTQILASDFSVWSAKEGHLKLVAPWAISDSSLAVDLSRDEILCFRAPPGFREVKSFEWSFLGRGTGRYDCLPGEGMLEEPGATPAAS